MVDSITNACRELSMAQQLVAHGRLSVSRQDLDLDVKWTNREALRCWKRWEARRMQTRVGGGKTHSARAVKAYRGAYAVEGATLYEARIKRKKQLGKVLRLKNHSDAIAAAHAFDRAALCLTRAHISKSPELSFPAADYEEESLPDLGGKDPAEMRDILAKAFSGTAAQPSGM